MLAHGGRAGSGGAAKGDGLRQARFRSERSLFSGVEEIERPPSQEGGAIRPWGRMGLQDFPRRTIGRAARRIRPANPVLQPLPPECPDVFLSG